MAFSKVLQSLIERLTKAERRHVGSSGKKRFRRRAIKKVKVKKTNEEKAAAALRKQKHHIEFKAAVDSARDVLFGEAEKLREQFGVHSREHYVKVITQSLTAKLKGTRKTNNWSVFVKYKTKEMNDGTYVSYPITQVP